MATSIKNLFVLRDPDFDGVTTIRYVPNTSTLLSGTETGKTSAWNLITHKHSSLFCCRNYPNDAIINIESLLFMPFDGSATPGKFVSQSRKGILAFSDLDYCETAVSVLETGVTSFVKLTIMRAKECIAMPADFNRRVQIIGIKSKKTQLEIPPLQLRDHFSSNTYQSTQSSFMQSPTIASLRETTALGENCLHVSYESLGMQAIYDLRNSRRPVSTPFSIPRLHDSTICSEVSESQCWLGLSSGIILCCETQPDGQITLKAQIDVFESYKCSTEPDDPHEFKKEMKELLETSCKTGIATIKLDSVRDIAIVGCWDGHTRVCSTQETRKRILQDSNFHEGSISAIDFGFNSNILFVSSMDSRISAWKISPQH